jgi:hypothetical protein
MLDYAMPVRRCFAGNDLPALAGMGPARLKSDKKVTQLKYSTKM